MRKAPRKILTAKFFDRPTLTVARDLLGKYVLRTYRGRTLALMITEVEAYNGLLDRASHAFRGRTPRTAVMFGPAGVFYIYFTYGMHWMANVVTGSKNYPAAVLLRAGAIPDPKSGVFTHVTGPARLTKYLHITRAQNGKPALKTSKLWFEDAGIKISPGKIIAGKRIGVDYAGKIWAGKPYNFKIIA